MGRITELRLRDVRCFAGEQTANLGRITLLVGENSSGKSTFLGCYKALSTLANLVEFDESELFDGPPFYMGTFETIARLGCPSFSLGGRFDDHCHSNALFEFTQGKFGTPVEQRVRLAFTGSSDETQSLDIERLRTSDVLRFTASRFRFDLPRSAISYAQVSTWLSRYVRHGYLPYNGEPSFFSKRPDSAESASDAVAFGKFVSFLRSELPLPKGPSFAVDAPDPRLPPRSRMLSSLPTYLEFGHVSDLAREAEIREGLEKAGNQLGLWDAVSVKRVALSENYQVLVNTPNGWRNLVDVGYGVHSLLPLLDAILSQEHETVFLLQQPEVHVHPSAQARFAQLMAESNHSFLVETHSEHLTDRFRICIMDGTLRPQDFSILYFERSEDKKNSWIHTIGLDSQANLLDVPTSYRSFFLRETERLMGFPE